VTAQKCIIAHNEEMDEINLHFVTI